MAETPGTPPGGATNQTNQPRLMVQTQYVKDLSFENPRGPFGLKPDHQFQVQIRELQVKRQKLAPDRHEVVLDVQLEGHAGEDTVFVLELSYAGLFVVLNVPESSLEPFLLIECPRLLFPFARRIIADVTRDGGFPPLLLEPLDFVALYRRQHQQAEAQIQAEGNGSPVPNPLVGDGAAG
jgi:preprotein translocase subunit SecB